jgi:glycosyltransferase involved in cell wall biosynthesis
MAGAPGKYRENKHIQMKPNYYYISHLQGNSGICKYSRDFYQLILKDKGYIFMDSAQDIIHILSTISSRDHVHIELGIFQQKEQEILFTMLRANYRNVSVTLHDPPLLKYPMNPFRHAFLHNVSKFYDVYINRFRWKKPFLQKIKAVYVLSRRGREVLEKKYGLGNVHYLPHVIDPAQMVRSRTADNNFIFFGFVGRNKGIGYSLKLHRHLMERFPDSHFYVVGKAMGREQRYYEALRRRYQHQVHYLGYIADEDLQQVFRQAAFALLLFSEYRFFHPFSGSLLQSMKMGKIVLTNRVNSVEEIIEEGKNGFFLSGNLKKDAALIGDLIGKRSLQDSMRKEIYQYLLDHHSPEKVAQYLKTEPYALFNPDRQLQ